MSSLKLRSSIPGRKPPKWPSIAKRWEFRSRFTQTATQSFVHDRLEWLAGLPGQIGKAFGQIIVQGQGGSHIDIMMPLAFDVKMSD